MLVIADSSPLIALVNIGHVEVLPKLFGQVVIPPAVASEIFAASRPQAVRDFAAALPAWLTVQAPRSAEPIPELHPGESEALTLAIELHADLVLVARRSPASSTPLAPSATSNAPPRNDCWTLESPSTG